MGLPCSSNSEGFIYLYVDRVIMLTPVPMSSLHFIPFDFLPCCVTQPINWKHQYPCECLVTHCFVGIMDLWTSLGTVDGVVLRLYMHEVYPRSHFWVWSLGFHFHLPPGEYWCFLLLFCKSSKLIIWPVILFCFSVFTSVNFCIVTNLLTYFTLCLFS